MPITSRPTPVAAATVNPNDFLLDNEPDSAGTTYSLTYTGATVTQEVWSNSGTGKTIKTIDYTYSGGNPSQETRKVFAADGTTVVAQLTVTYTFTGNQFTSAVSVRNI